MNSPTPVSPEQRLSPDVEGMQQHTHLARLHGLAAIPERPVKKGVALLKGLQPQLDAYPDTTLGEHCQIWETTQGVQVSTASMSRASEQQKARAVWREPTQALDANKLVIVDKCGSTIALIRLYAQSAKGKRAYGAIPHNRRANITLLAAISL